MPEIIGWGSALILLPAFAVQTYRQWKNRHEPVNASALWFFVLVLIGTGGQVAYSWMVRNWVYLALNSALVVNNGVGLGIAIRRRTSQGTEKARDSHGPVTHDAGESTTSPGTTPPRPQGASTMSPEDRGESNPDHPAESSEDRPASAPGGGDQPASVVVTTVDPAIASGRSPQPLRPNERVVAETSRLTRAVSGPVAPSSPLVEPSPAGPTGPPRHDDRGPEGRKEPARPQRPGWLRTAIVAAAALVVGAGLALAYSHFGSPGQDRSQGGDPSKQARNGGDSSKGQAKGGGQGNDSGASGHSTSEAPMSPSAEGAGADPGTMKQQIQQLYTRFEALQHRLDAMTTPRDTNPPDLAAMRVKVGELTSTIEGIEGLPARSREMENRLDRLQEDLKGLRDQLSAEKPKRTAAAGANAPNVVAVNGKLDPAPAPPPPIPAIDAVQPDELMASGVALFKKGEYPRAAEIFRKLQAMNSGDARVWYFSALARGFSTGEWGGETRTLVKQGAELEQSGLPPSSQIDAAFAELSPAQGKDWLTSYRSQLVKH